MTTTSEAQGLVEQLDPRRSRSQSQHSSPQPRKLQHRPSGPAGNRSWHCRCVPWPSMARRRSIHCRLIFRHRDDDSMAELLPRREASAPKPDPVVAALKDIQSAQQQHTASLQEHALQQNAALLQQDSMVLLSATEHHGRTGGCQEDIFTAVHAHREGRYAAKCDDVGRHVLDPKSECTLWTVGSDAEADGSAVEVCRAGFRGERR